MQKQPSTAEQRGNDMNILCVVCNVGASKLLVGKIFFQRPMNPQRDETGNALSIQ